MPEEAYDICHCWPRGAAGCIVASYLAEHTDASIALIEAGDMDRDPFIHIPAGFANMLVHDRHVWKYETVPQHGTKRAYRSGKVLGGGSSINAMCYVRGQIRETWSPCIPDDMRNTKLEDLKAVSRRPNLATLSRSEWLRVGGEDTWQARYNTHGQ